MMPRTTNSPSTLRILPKNLGRIRTLKEGLETIDVYESAGTGGNETFDQLLFVNEATGAVQYFTTLTHTHDGEDMDGDGNLVTMTLVANDGTADSASVDVSLRIDVKATAITLGTAGGWLQRTWSLHLAA